MSLRLHEQTVQCIACGSNLWRVTVFIYDLSAGMTTPREDDPVCPKCQRIRYLQLLKNASKIEPLLPAGEAIKVKGGVSQEKMERPLDATPEVVEKAIAKAKINVKSLTESIVSDEDIESANPNEPTKQFTVDDWINHFIPEDEQKKKVWFT